MYTKMNGILHNISEGYNNSGGDLDVLALIESARKKYNLDAQEVEHLKFYMGDAIRSQKRARGEFDEYH